MRKPLKRLLQPQTYHAIEKQKTITRPLKPYITLLAFCLCFHLVGALQRLYKLHFNFTSHVFPVFHSALPQMSGRAYPSLPTRQVEVRGYDSEGTRTHARDTWYQYTGTEETDFSVFRENNVKQPGARACTVCFILRTIVTVQHKVRQYTHHLQITPCDRYRKCPSE